MPDSRTTWLRRGGLALFLLTAALVAVAVGLDTGIDDGALDRGLVWAGSFIAVVGVLVTWARPRNAVGWLLQATALAGAGCNAGQVYGERALVVGDLELPAATAVLSLTAPLWIWSLVLPVTLLLVRYPRGRLESAWARRLHAASLTGLLLVTAAYSGSVESVTDVAPGHAPPVVLPDPVAVGLFVVGAALFLPSLLGIVVHAVGRMLRAGHPERQQLALLFTAAVAAAVAIFFEVPYAGSVAYPGIAVAVAVGVLRYDLLGIDVVVRRTLLYAPLTALVLVVFVAVTAGLTAVVPDGRAPEFVAASVIAVGLVPARDRLQRLVDRLVYGDRRDPWAALQRLGTPVGGTPDTGLLPAVAAALADSLRVPGVVVRDADGAPAATVGEVTDDALVRPLLVGGEPAGAVVVALRRGEERFPDADVRLLDAVAPLVAVVLRTVRLTDQLRAERARVVDAAAAERDRLRRELHDGLGPSLTGVGLGLEALESRTGTSPLTERLRMEVAAAIDEVRRILDDLRPGALDELGLVGALRRRAEQLAAAGVRVEVEGPTGPLVVPPEVEAAAYRIADEALANVVRHAHATRCSVRVELNGGLRVAVTDDGSGIPQQREGGVGLPSMRTRAEQLGGRFSAEQTGSGTSVVVELPLPVT
ncbi:MAG: sensor histidine kinase, partial [Actinomycetes bacterium]